MSIWFETLASATANHTAADPNSSESFCTLISRCMRGTVYKHSLLTPALIQPLTARFAYQLMMIGFEKEFPFCSNPDCILYVRGGEKGVIGWGNWAPFPDGRIIGRSIYNSIYLCDICRHEWRPVPTFAVAISE